MGVELDLLTTYIYQVLNQLTTLLYYDESCETLLLICFISNFEMHNLLHVVLK